MKGIPMLNGDGPWNITQASHFYKKFETNTIHFDDILVSLRKRGLVLVEVSPMKFLFQLGPTPAEIPPPKQHLDIARAILEDWKSRGLSIGSISHFNNALLTRGIPYSNGRGVHLMDTLGLEVIPKFQFKLPINSSSDVVGPAVASHNPSPQAQGIQQETVPPHILVSKKEDMTRVLKLLRKEKFLYVDCEGVNLGKKGKLCLIQIGCESNDLIFLFDIVVFPDVFDCGLRGILENPECLKVFHAPRNDFDALQQHGVVCKPYLDTQTEHMNLTKRKNISLRDLVAFHTKREYLWKDDTPHKKDFEIWSKRPLQPKTIEYAVLDIHLFRIAARLMNCFVTSTVPAARSSKAVSALPSVAEVIPSPSKQGRFQVTLQDEFDEFMQSLPKELALSLVQHVPEFKAALVDVILDLGLPPVFTVVREDGLRTKSIPSGLGPVSEEDLQQVLYNCSAVTDSNRACRTGTLHRYSFIFNDFEKKDPVGLTIRVAREFIGLSNALTDVLAANQSILLVGPPGYGKTTLLRDMARSLADPEGADQRVMVVDTSNEIAGDDRVPHKAIGYARRMKVLDRSSQYLRMLEAVQNHTPEVLVIDEIGTSQEVREAVGVAQRGIRLIATTHGQSLLDIALNPDLKLLLGGYQAVILSAEERRNEQSESKTRRERLQQPTFGICVELRSRCHWRIHWDVAAAADALLKDDNRAQLSVEDRMVDVESGTFTSQVKTISAKALSS